MGFRRIAAYLYKMNKRWDKSTELSKGDMIWQDAMETTAASGNIEQAESLLRFFVDKNEPECFAACLFSCYELIKPDTVLELAWRYNLFEWAMPYMVQAFAEVTTQLTEITEKQDSAAQTQKQAEDAAKEAEEKDAELSAGFLGTNPNYNPELQPLGLPAPMGAQMQMSPQMPMGMVGQQMMPQMGQPIGQGMPGGMGGMPGYGGYNGSY